MWELEIWILANNLVGLGDLNPRPIDYEQLEIGPVTPRNPKKSNKFRGLEPLGSTETDPIPNQMTILLIVDRC